MRYDVAIIGIGPAGLSAAITLKIRNKNILLIGSKDLSDKLRKAHRIDNYLGMPEIAGSDLADAYLTHLDRMGIEITEESITNIYAMGQYFSLQTKNNEMLEASAVIIATGVNFGKPYPGENEFLGRGVSYCATCDAPLYRGKKVIVIGSSEKEEAEADFLAEIAEKVTYIPLYKDAHASDAVEVLYETPVSIAGGMKADTLVTDQSEHKADGIFILRENISPENLVPGLTMDGSHIAVNRNMETNLKGCFACGDVVGAPYQYIKAAGEGNVAAIAAVQYLNELKSQ